ncbi:hypothetical protein Y032_0009g683 [Ancylostoma ceylanicum]|uniref:Uncharacterized protein n=1 Tax=Ancylostoma ceylanicum TaxID=53326 RepID=A0A016VKS7_9BILA|nr:hypothetical protein Y032_0009g683 [Ancylostoma ceylanicum]
MKCRGFFASVAALSVQGDDRMRRALTVLLTFCTVASTAVDCPATNITQRDVDRSLFVALVEVNSIEAKGNQDNDYFMFNVWYEKLFKWYHYWITEHTIMSIGLKKLQINQKCRIFLDRGKKFVLGCTSNHHCHFVKAYENLTSYERELIRWR